MIQCVICGTVFSSYQRKTEVCPYCGWLDGFDCGCDDDEPNEANFGMTMREAKALLAQGKDIFGEPLGKRPPDDTEEN